jgi:hypothetical protein
MAAERMNRSEAVRLVGRLIAGDYASDADAIDLLKRLERGLCCPHISNFIFHPASHRQPTAEQVVEQALAYQPFAL